MNEHGSLTTVLTDGHDLLVYADKRGEGHLYLWRVAPPYERLVFGDADVEVDLTQRGAKSRKGVIVCSDPLASSTKVAAEWTKLPPGTLLVLRQGAVRAEVAPSAVKGEPPLVRLPRIARPSRAEVKRLDVRHRTAYRYQKPVEKSTHLLRVVPVHDRLQSLLFHETMISVDGQLRDYEDVFGNQARRVWIETPFTELVIEARSRLELLDTDPLSFRPLRARSTIPLVWMPWQRHMLQPYLLPPELPETELTELTEYAMSFVERNDYDLLDTLLDINWTIFKEYQYRQGTTTVFTTPFEVYANRQGVCQDFTNLFICLARLLGVPARYVCGYIYTGPKNASPGGPAGEPANQRQGEASHAWVQVYLPEVGWKGFDPTNGVLTQTDHIRVAVGRSYVDATPTSGTIYVGGGGETLEVDVRCELVGDAGSVIV
jgi:transglutaminase-like putative cysteine protease